MICGVNQSNAGAIRVTNEKGTNTFQGVQQVGQGAQGSAGFDGGSFYQQGQGADFSGFEDLFGRFGAGFGASTGSTRTRGDGA